MTMEQKLISANALISNSDVFTIHTKEYGSIEVIPVDAIGDAPAVDAEEVCRCKDCGCSIDIDGVCYCTHWSKNTDPMGYCHESC